MITCTFFGHSNCPPSISDKLSEVLKDLVQNHSVNMFYVGNHGGFDRIVRYTLKKLKSIYPQIEYAVVLAYMPQKWREFDTSDYSDTMLPEGIECIHPRYAITWRNKWMLQHSEYVVTYITHSFGGAVQFADMAKRQKKHVINLSDLP